jgi:hypothetical protein
VSSYLPFQQSFVVKQIALHMDSKFYHFNIDIDIAQAKIFCSPLTFARGHSDLAGGTAPFDPLGYGPESQATEFYRKSKLPKLQINIYNKASFH